jgi:actin-like ATPase involved in cell morphogenesis
MSSFGLSVDYGTSTTVAFLRWPDGRTRPLLFDDSPLLPSAVYLEDDGRLLTGRDAVRSARFAPARYEANPKRHIDERELLLGDRVVPVEDLIAATLRTVWQEAGRTADTPPTELTLTHPAAWAEPRRALLRQAAERAGLPVPRLVPEPVAAATYFATVLGHQVAPGGYLAVYDLGAGTFDVSILRRDSAGFTPVLTDGLDGVGGLDLDAIVVDQVRAGAPAEYEELWRRLRSPRTEADQRAFRELWDGAREAKQALSRRPSAMVQVPGIAEPQRVTRTEFEEAATPVLAGTVHRTEQAIRAAVEHGGEAVGLFLVGGSTRVPLVAALLHRATGVPPTVLEQPELVVAEGALHIAGSPQTSKATPPPVPVPVPTPVSVPASVEAPPVREKRRRRLAPVLAALLAVALVATGVLLWKELPGREGTEKDNTVLSGQPDAAGALGSAPTSLPASTAAPSASARATTATTRTQATGPAVVTPKLLVVRSTYNGPCPPPGNTPIELYGEITVTGGPTTVTYFWRAHPGWDFEEVPRQLRFTSPGKQRTAGFFGGWGGPGQPVSYWAQLIVTAPLSWQSQQVTWTTTCTS